MLLYPAAHRQMFGEQMLQTFGDHYRDVVEDRGGSRLRFWLSAFADLAASVIREYAVGAAARFRLRRRARPSARPAGVPKRQMRVARRLRYRTGARRKRELAYRGRVAVLIPLLGLVGLALVTGAVNNRLGAGALVAGLAVAVGLAHGLRLARPVLTGPRGDGPTPPGGAAVREPRRPLPMSPSGCGARPSRDPDESGHAIAMI
ncbi:hypothetical protein [Actinoplanes sp. NPDC051411]|uniref:hypothetical protein n=1 Tax=Actinoplanes sp. NPDC051411 TaxID=3155522 RepID=UPI00342AD918